MTITLALSFARGILSQLWKNHGRKIHGRKLLSCSVRILSPRTASIVSGVANMPTCRRACTEREDDRSWFPDRVAPASWTLDADAERMIDCRVILLKWAIPGPFFLHFRLFRTFESKWMFNINFADCWIRTEDLWLWKRPLYQLSHNLLPS